jgi:hypothetical protein
MAEVAIKDPSAFTFTAFRDSKMTGLRLQMDCKDADSIALLQELTLRKSLAKRTKSDFREKITTNTVRDRLTNRELQLVLIPVLQTAGRCRGSVHHDHEANQGEFWLSDLRCSSGTVPRFDHQVFGTQKLSVLIHVGNTDGRNDDAADRRDSLTMSSMRHSC